MNYNDAKKIINKLNARLKTLQNTSENSYKYAIEQLKRVGQVLTSNNTISTSQKKLDMGHLDDQMNSIIAAVPTMTDEIEHIKDSLAQIDQKRLEKYKENKELLKKYKNEMSARDKTILLSELNAKRHFDIVDLLDLDGLNDLYDEWKKKKPVLDKPDALVNLENEILEKLGKGRAGIRSYAELYELQKLLDQYFDDKLVQSAQLVSKVDLT